MGKLRTVHRCTECGATAPKWVGRCGACGEWNTLIEELEEPRSTPAAEPAGSRPVPVSELPSGGAPPLPTRIDELDRVLGGGLVPGSVTVVGGEPGIGKSTLLLQALASMAVDERMCLLVSAEESAAQVRSRAERLGLLPPKLLLHAESALPHIVSGIDAVAPDVCVVDSMQTVFDPELSSSAGSVLQVRECAAGLTRIAKDRNMACVLVGHVTKDGTLAGPRVVEHLVDTVLAFEGERHHSLRLLRAVKHRYGATGELGLFEMADSGLVGVSDPGGLLLGDRRAGVAGSLVVPAIEGRRPILVEVQALVSSSSLPQPRRSAQGLDAGRVALLVAVLARHAKVHLHKQEVYVSAVGGVRVNEPAADLAIALALASAYLGRPVPTDMVACGEIGLAGEVRQVHQTARRLAEAARLGFRRAIVPMSAPDGPPSIALQRVGTVAEAVALALADAPEEPVPLALIRG